VVDAMSWRRFARPLDECWIRCVMSTRGRKPPLRIARGGLSAASEMMVLVCICRLLPSFLEPQCDRVGDRLIDGSRSLIASSITALPAGQGPPRKLPGNGIQQAPTYPYEARRKPTSLFGCRGGTLGLVAG